MAAGLCVGSTVLVELCGIGGIGGIGKNVLLRQTPTSKSPLLTNSHLANIKSTSFCSNIDRLISNEYLALSYMVL